MSLLRKAFAAHHPDGGKLIVTVSGRGYRFVADVEEVAAARSDKASATAREIPELPEVAPLPSTPRRRWLLSVIALAIVLGALPGWVWYNRSVPGDHHEIVLADFENGTGDSSFDRALNIALAIDLKQSPWLDIAPEARTRDTLKLMERAPEQKLTTALAREVCRRMNAQAVVGGLIARFGARYLVTLSATDCAGRDLVQTKAEARSRDEVPGAVDSVSAQMRRRLGEPLKSLGRFNKPLLAKATGSLDALKAYSAAHELSSQGKFQESVPLFQRAIELDPRFAMAYADLGSVYGSLGEPGLSTAASRKAFDLREMADERDRFFITTSYYSHVTGDYHAAIRNDETWTEVYPQDLSPWTGIADFRIQIGQPEAAIGPAKRDLAIDSRNAIPYIHLARAQLYAGHVDEAIATCRQAIAQKADGAEIHGVLVFAGFATHDEAMIEAQGAWARGTPSEPFITLEQMLVAFAEGRPRRGEELLNRVTEGYKQRGLAERAERMRGGLPRLEADLGMTDSARRILDELPPIQGYRHPRRAGGDGQRREGGSHPAGRAHDETGKHSLGILGRSPDCRRYCARATQAARGRGSSAQEYPLRPPRPPKSAPCGDALIWQRSSSIRRRRNFER